MVALNDGGSVLAEENVHFDNDLPEYRTHGGAHVRCAFRGGPRKKGKLKSGNDD